MEVRLEKVFAFLVDHHTAMRYPAVVPLDSAWVRVRPGQYESVLYVRDLQSVAEIPAWAERNPHSAESVMVQIGPVKNAEFLTILDALVRLGYSYRKISPKKQTFHDLLRFAAHRPVAALRAVADVALVRRVMRWKYDLFVIFREPDANPAEPVRPYRSLSPARI